MLPVINNLLENREMALEDGRFIVSPARHAELVERHDEATVRDWNLVRAHPDFLVIAIGLPSPPYFGNPLDPPLRSRFQARTEGLLTVSAQLLEARRLAPHLNSALLVRLISVARVIHEMHGDAQGGAQIPDFPHALLETATRILIGCTDVQHLSSKGDEFIRYAMGFCYPFSELGRLYLDREIRLAILSLYEQLKIGNTVEESGARTRVSVDGTGVAWQSEVQSIRVVGCDASSSSRAQAAQVAQEAQARAAGARHYVADVQLRNGVAFRVPIGASHAVFAHAKDAADLPVARRAEMAMCTDYQLATLGRCLHAHSLGDFCIVGPKGVGKSFLVRAFADMLGYGREQTILICLYKDMTSNDIFESRRTRPNGDTYWEFSALLKVALDGGIAVLDGIEQIHPGTLASLQRLVKDREILLPSSRRFMSRQRCLSLLSRLRARGKEGVPAPGDEDRCLAWLAECHGVHAVHPSFRIVALARPPSGMRGLERGSWMTSEVCTIFPFVWVRPLSAVEEASVIRSRAPAVGERSLALLVNLVQMLRNSSKDNDEILMGLSESLSTRQVIRLCKQLEDEEEDAAAGAGASAASVGAGALLHRSVHRVCLSRFMPPVVRAALDTILTDVNIHAASTDALPSTSPSTSALSISTVKDADTGNEYLEIGRVRYPLPRVSKAPMLVPQLLFYENPRQTQTLMEMLKDFAIGEHLLLIGNQGVGKNKLADKFLQMLRLPREYIQLHRDTTVSQLTTQPSIVAGNVVFNDSPLVRAAKEGYVLVIDEADKAPTHVTALLKGLAEDREMLLGDGRRIREMEKQEGDDICLHPDFRMIVLANRPGYPFLGNDFFKIVGSVFSTFAIDNPDGESELALLRKFAPSVPETTVRKLVAAFHELREHVEEGSLTYPYSTRELVNMVRHMEAFPKDGISMVLRNIFDFDKFRGDERDVLVDAFRRQGIVLDTDVQLEICLGIVSPLPPASITEEWVIGDSRRAVQHGSGGQTPSVATLEPVVLPLPCVAGTVYACGAGASAAAMDLPSHNDPDKKRFERFDLRAETFGEAEFYFHAPGRGNVCDAVVLDSGRIVLARHYIGELDLELVDMDTDTVRMLDSKFACPPLASTRGIFRPLPPKIALDKLRGERFLVHNPRDHGLSVVDAQTGQVRHFVVPFEKTTPQPGQSTNSRIVVSASLNEDLVVCYRSGGRQAFFLHIEGGASSYSRPLGDMLYRIDLPFALADVHAVGRELWILQSRDDGPTMPASYHAMQFGPRVAATRICRIKRALQTFNGGIQNRGLSFLSKSANRIDGRAAPKGMVDRLFRHCASPGVYAHIVPGLGAALGAMRGGTVPVFSYTRNEKNDNQSPGRANSNIIASSASRLFLRKSQQLVTLQIVGASAEVEVVSVVEGIVRRVSVPIGEGGAAAAAVPKNPPINALFGTSKPKTFVLPTQSAGIWKSLTSKPGISAIARELKDGRLLLIDFSGKAHVLEVRTAEIMKALEDWARLIGEHGNQEILEVGMSVDGEDFVIDGADGDVGEEGSENGHGEGEGEGDGDGDGKGNGSGKGDGDGNGEGKGQGGGKGGGSNTGNRKGGSGDVELLDPLQEYETVVGTQSISNKSQNDRAVKELTPEIMAQVKAAKEAAWKRLIEKLDMDEIDLQKYEAYRERVKIEIRQLRVVLDGLEARKNERTWLRNKDAGDLDDRKLVDGLTGSRNIYKARGEVPPDGFGFQELPKRLHFLFDLSMSMSRYAMDGRLQRSLEAATMVMESMRGLDHRFSYKIAGHSGDSENVRFVDEGKPPSNDRERLQVLRKMNAHADLCDSGDNTLTAIQHSVREIVKKEADDYACFLITGEFFSFSLSLFGRKLGVICGTMDTTITDLANLSPFFANFLFVCSFVFVHFVIAVIYICEDANTEQYGYTASDFEAAIRLNPKVRVFVIVIGSLGDQGYRLQSQLPPGSCYICMDTTDVPKVLRSCLEFIM